MPLVPGNGPQVVVEFAARAPVAPPVPLRVSMMRTGWKKLLEPSAASTRVVLSRLHPAVPAPEARDAQMMLFASRTSSPPEKFGGCAGVNVGGPASGLPLLSLMLNWNTRPVPKAERSKPEPD